MDDHNEQAILSLSPEQKLRLIAEIVEHYRKSDENIGDTSETYDTIQWIATCGKHGRNWGHGWIYREMKW